MRVARGDADLSKRRRMQMLYEKGRKNRGREGRSEKLGV